jgi:hypothetical protein
MKGFFLLIFLLGMMGGISAQHTALKGRVVTEGTGKPLSAVSVYLNNTSRGTVTDEQGRFLINDIPAGRSRLVASCVGYETYAKGINSNDLPAEFIINLKPRPEDLKGVEVKLPDPDGWKKWGKLFTDIFIGTSSNSFGCKLENPDVIKFRLNPDNTLTVYATEPIQISNLTLGFEIKYTLEEFEYDRSSKVVVYNGYALFTDLALSHPKKASKWKESRQSVYKGSLLHFMRSFFVNKLDDQGFELRSLEKISNPEKDRAKRIFRQHRDSTIIDTADSRVEFLFNPMGYPQAVIKSLHTKDSTPYFRKMLLQPDSVISHQLLSADSLGFAADSSTAGLYFRDSLEVSYKLKAIPPEYRRLNKSHKQESYPVSQFVFVNKKPIYVLGNGYYYGPYDLKVTGYWAWWETMSTLLPFDYVPGKE